MRDRCVNTTRATPKRRGTAYVLVLGITAMLVVMGISAAMLSRVTLEKNKLDENQAAVRLAAEVALDVTHKQLTLIDAATWRAAATNDQWESRQTYADAAISVKFVDEIDGNLSNNTTDRFRLYTRAVRGDAVRIYSVEFVPDGEGGYDRLARTFRQDTLD